MLVDLCQRLAPRALLVVDEAYVEFSSRPSLAAQLPQLPNLAMLRTLSKAHGLAGARCGSLLAAPEIIALARKVIPPYAITEMTVETVAPLLQEQRRCRHARARGEAAAGTRAAGRCTGKLAAHHPRLAQRRQLPAGGLPGSDDVLARARARRPAHPRCAPACPARFGAHHPLARPKKTTACWRACDERCTECAAQRVLFVDRDGTLIEEPPDEQVDSLEKIRFLPGVFAALQRLTAAGFGW